MEASRGRKNKRVQWQMTLGVKEVIFAGLAILGLMMMAFSLGALAGRGDIYRVAYGWGLLTPDASRVAQWLPPGGGPAAAPAAPVAAAAPGAAPATPGGPATAAAKTDSQAPVTGTIAPVPGSPAQKKGKGASPARDKKAKEEEMKKIRKEVVGKLKFQNSFDTPPKPRLTQKQKPKEKAGAAKPQPSQVKVGQFRDSKAAKAKMAELQKKGVKATLKQTKDSKGPLYTVYKQTSTPQQDTENLAQKSSKTGEKKAQSPGASENR